MTSDRRRVPRSGPLAAPASEVPTGSTSSTDAVEAAVAGALAARRPGEVTGVLVVHLDRADLLADAYGWDVVADLIADVAGRLRRTIRADDRLLPSGRDALSLVAGSMPGQRDVALLADRMVRAAARPLALPDGVEHELTVSVGAAVGRGDEPPAALLARAERHCRRVAGAGGGRWSVEPVDSYTDRTGGAVDTGRALRDAAAARLRQAGELGQALAARTLDLVLTPLVPLTPGAVDAFTPGVTRDGPGATFTAGEWQVADVRWRHPVRGLLHPAALLSAVRDAGLAGAYLETVLRLVTSAAVDASVAAGQPVRVAVEVPLTIAAQARAQGTDLTALFTGAVARARLDPSQLAPRITVDDARVGGDALAPTLDQLAGLGMTAMLTGVDPSPGTLAWLDAWPHAAVWLLDRAVAAALAPTAPGWHGAGDGPAPPELASAAVLARAGAAAVVAAARARGIVTGAEGVDDPAVAAELAAAGVGLAHGRWAARSSPAPVPG